MDDFCQTHVIALLLIFLLFFTDPCEKGEVLCRLKKTTFQRASENAFSKVLIVVLASGKIHVEINTTYEETLDDIAEMRHEQFIKVIIQLIKFSLNDTNFVK